MLTFSFLYGLPSPCSSIAELLYMHICFGAGKQQAYPNQE